MRPILRGEVARSILKIYADLCRLEELQPQEKEVLELVRRITKTLRDQPAVVQEEVDMLPPAGL